MLLNFINDGCILEKKFKHIKLFKAIELLKAAFV